EIFKHCTLILLKTYQETTQRHIGLLNFPYKQFFQKKHNPYKEFSGISDILIVHIMVQIT
ncbi:hypothetical protein, partial [Paenibacillus odorifer]|uniref:hypothetical protein n=1 Tax=Paenibacillus odorifer TaxID=189426 RepID=UPI001C4AC34B